MTDARKLIEEARAFFPAVPVVSSNKAFLSPTDTFVLFELARSLTGALEAALAREQRKDEALRQLALTHEFVGTIFNPRERHADDCPGCLAEEALAAVPAGTQEAAEPDDYSRPGWKLFPVM